MAQLLKKLWFFNDLLWLTDRAGASLLCFLGKPITCTPLQVAFQELTHHWKVAEGEEFNSSQLLSPSRGDLLAPTGGTLSWTAAPCKEQPRRRAFYQLKAEGLFHAVCTGKDAPPLEVKNALLNGCSQGTNSWETPTTVSSSSFLPTHQPHSLAAALSHQ